MKTSKMISLAVLLALGAAFVGGCEPKNVDPQAKVDAPGYYNGPMKPKSKGSGVAATSAAAANDAPAGTSK